MEIKLRVPIKIKVFGLVAILVFFALALILFQTNRVFKSDKEDFVKEMNARLTSASGKNIAEKVAAIQDKLVVFISSKESLAHTGARVQDQNLVLFQRYQEFLSIALMTANESDDLKTSWIIRNPFGESNKLPPGMEKEFLSAVSVKQAKQNRRWFWKTQTSDGQWIMVLGFSVEVVDKKEAPSKKKSRNVAQSNESSEPKTSTAWIFGFLPSRMTQDLIQDFSSGINSAMIVDEKGVVVAASDTNQLWKNLSTHPVVSEVMKNSRPSGTGDYIDLDSKSIVGSFENIPKLNLGVVVTTPREKAFEAAGVLVRNIIFIGAIVLFAAIGTAIILSNYITRPLQKLAKIAAIIGGGDFSVPVDVKTNDEIGDLASSFSIMEKNLIERDAALEGSKQALLQSEKMSAFGQLSAGIAHEVKNPLAGILGHAQLAMGKVQNDDIKKHLEVIEKETRRCKSIVENLMKFARAEKVTLEPTDLAQVCQDTINLVEHQLTLAGCKIFKDFQPCPKVLANGNQLQQVLLNLMVNASHAMENCAKKNVIVRTLQTNGKAQIQVEDTGVGMPPEVQKKIFEPFFTTKPAGKGTGLGLSVSIGIVKDHKGEIYTKSEINQGTTFFIDIPIPEGAKMPDKPLENTHGGTYLTSDAKALADAKVHEKVISKVAELKPTDLQKDLSTKQIDKALDDFDLRKNSAGKVTVAPVDSEPQTKPVTPVSSVATPPIPGQPLSLNSQSQGGASERIASKNAKQIPPTLDGLFKSKKEGVEPPPSHVKASEDAKIKVELPTLPVKPSDVAKGKPELPNIPLKVKENAKTKVELPTLPVKPRDVAKGKPELPSIPVKAKEDTKIKVESPAMSSKPVEAEKINVELPSISAKASDDVKPIAPPVVDLAKPKIKSASTDFQVKIKRPKLKA